MRFVCGSSQLVSMVDWLSHFQSISFDIVSLNININICINFPANYCIPSTWDCLEHDEFHPESTHSGHLDWSNWWWHINQIWNNFVRICSKKFVIINNSSQLKNFMRVCIFVCCWMDCQDKCSTFMWYNTVNQIHVILYCDFE